jgi:hypothetical protein
MEFVIELAVVTAALLLVTVGISLVFLGVSGLYRNKRAAIITPMIFAIAIGAIGPTDHTSLGQWAYYTLPSMALAAPWVSSSCYRKRIKEKGN